MAKYMVTGWCARRSNWQEDYITAKNKQQAVEQFKYINPSLRSVKAHRLHKDTKI